MSNSIQTGLAPTTDFVAYTPNALNLGTITSPTFYWRRLGGAVQVVGSFITGTPGAGLASLSLPLNLTPIDLPKYTGVGTVLQDAMVEFPYSVLATSGSSAVFFSRADGALNPQQPQNGSALFAANGAVTISVIIPVAEFTIQG